MLKEDIYINCPQGILKITCMCIRKKVTEDYPIIIIHKFISTDQKIIRATIIAYLLYSLFHRPDLLNTQRSCF